ncbi:MAG: hypothetical protein H7X71_02910 [Chitinophagales bacterium]|nr:hypothetical protein [Chitinophagales bacterium]
MRPTFIFLNPIIFFSAHLFSQAPEIGWQNTIGESCPAELYSIPQTFNEATFLVDGPIQEYQKSIQFMHQ